MEKMQSNEQGERKMDNNKKLNKFDIDIEIKDLLWEFLRRWRMIVVLALVCGIGLTAYQYRADMNKTDVVTVKKTQEELESSMGTQDLDEVTAAVALRRQADEKSAYMEHSQLMKINPYEENAVFLQYYVSAETDNIALDVNDAYIAYADQGSLAKDVADSGTYEMEQVYLAELISIVREKDSAYINTKSVSDRMALTIEGSTEEHVFTVKVVGVSKEAAETLAADVERALQAYSSIAEANIGTHQLHLMNKNTVVITDQSLAELQNWNATSIKTISNNLDSMKNEMTGDQISLYTYRTTVLAETQNTAAPAPTTEKTVSISFKHTIIGIVVGIVLACGLIFVLYLFAPALRSSEEVKTLYQVKVLGLINDEQFRKKKMFGFVDTIIYKLQNCRKKILNYEQELQMICANIALDCGKNGKKEVFLTSSTMEVLPEEIVRDIVKKCEEKEITVTVGDAVSYDAEALEQLARVGQVVFIEKKRVSLYDELYNEVLLCKEHSIDVIGMIIVGA